MIQNILQVIPSIADTIRRPKNGTEIGLMDFQWKGAHYEG